MDERFIKLYSAIDKRREEIIGLGEEIYRKPETGYREFGTAALVSQQLNGLGLKYQSLEDIPGIKATIDTGREGPRLAIIGELDSIICAEHPDCDSKTGAIHGCGHNIQIAAMLGTAMGILDSGLLEGLSGKFHLIAVPAEELIEIEFRKELKEKGVIRYLGGKPELLYRGFFDDVDMCAMIHSAPGAEKLSFSTTANGCIAKKVRYMGKATHAGQTPQEGINALYAANLGIAAINSLRETFMEKHYIRVHPIITKGGDIVNVIPADVRIETFVRGKTIEAMLDADRKVDRALVGGALAMGAKVEISNLSGYFPFTNNRSMISIAEKLAFDLIGEEAVIHFEHATGSSDYGDLSALMPVLEIGTGGVSGGLHSADYRIADYEASYILSSKILGAVAVEMLGNNGCKGHEVIAGFKPLYKSKQEYFDFADGLFATRLLPAVDYI